MQQFDSIRSLLLCSRSAAISHPAGMPSFSDGSHHAFILPAIACLEKHERHRILCYDTGLVVCEENPDPMLHNNMYLCM